MVGRLFFIVKAKLFLKAEIYPINIALNQDVKYWVENTKHKNKTKYVFYTGDFFI